MLFEPEVENIDALRRDAAGCRACPLYATATQTVFGEGPVPALLMLVGEQPGDQEDLAGRPFVGPAGMLLDFGELKGALRGVCDGLDRTIDECLQGIEDLLATTATHLSLADLQLLRSDAKSGATGRAARLHHAGVSARPRRASSRTQPSRHAPTVRVSQGA